LTDRRLKDLTLLYRSELDREEKRVNSMRLLGLGSVTLLLLVLLGVAYRNTLMERKRNRLLVERLHEYDRANQTLIEKITEPSQENEEDSLISRLDRHMITDHPYTDPTLGRSELAEFLGITQDALAQLIRSEHDQTVHAYINSYRAEEARRILDSDSTETIAEIAARLGFGTARTLQRAFKERFDMSPTQYKEAASAIRSADNS
ncbi:MAG: helix-turn-helix domain-containing protein, partial [Muribaculaceae bacterium]|nr:helix-turn-helix domain-containing protein [Muribaculaceae bacterium]